MSCKFRIERVAPTVTMSLSRVTCLTCCPDKPFPITSIPESMINDHLEFVAAQQALSILSALQLPSVRAGTKWIETDSGQFQFKIDQGVVFQRGVYRSGRTSWMRTSLIWEIWCLDIKVKLVEPIEETL